MRQFVVLPSVMVVLLLGFLLLLGHPGALAQEATPAADTSMEGVSFEPVSFTPDVDIVSPSNLLMFRFEINPGAGFPIEESDPSIAVFFVESGALTVQVDESVIVTRGAELGEAMATAETTGDSSSITETMTAGEAVTLKAGDAAYIPASLTGEVRNEGQEQATGFAFVMVPSAGMTSAATPTP